MTSPTANTRWPADESSQVAETLVIDGSGWDVSVFGFCNVDEPAAPGGCLQFSPSVGVTLRLNGRHVDSRILISSNVLTPNPSSWNKSVAHIMEFVRMRARESHAPDPEEAITSLPAALSKARALAARALVSAQAAYLIEIIPSMEAISAWGEAEVRFVMDS